MTICTPNTRQISVSVHNTQTQNFRSQFHQIMFFSVILYFYFEGNLLLPHESWSNFSTSILKNGT